MEEDRLGYKGPQGDLEEAQKGMNSGAGGHEEVD